ncbi:unnamed protein product [Menidia menidia]|uniref:COMM domain-containing protein 1 n=1 Tax=Menidia menidia TaxID=238744 RepID=A0A8S4BJN6_9TELE|nr:unnamed protein product [Menidia menidia]
MSDPEATKSLGCLLNGIAQKIYFNNNEITEDLLKEKFYPEMTQEEFNVLYEKTEGLLKSIARADMDHAQLEAFLTAQTKKQGGGGMSVEQTAAIFRFWKNQRVRVRESLLGQSRWEPSLKALFWRVDLQVVDSCGNTDNSRPVVLIEMELVRAEKNEFLCLEFDEVKVDQVLKKMANIQESINRIVNHT